MKTKGFFSPLLILVAAESLVLVTLTVRSTTHGELRRWEGDAQNIEL